MLSYALGHNMGGSLKAAGIEIDSAYFNAGFYDALEGEQRMTQEEIHETVENEGERLLDEREAELKRRLIGFESGTTR